MSEVFGSLRKSTEGARRRTQRSRYGVRSLRSRSNLVVAA